MIGQTLGHYRILDKLGAGGMGEVYLAEDATLKRQVALKVLPAELAASQDRLERFQREAETLAAIDHPNIVHIYSIESADVGAAPTPDREDVGEGLAPSRAAASSAPTRTVRFLTMQLVEGKPLSDMIPDDGMPVERVLEISIPLVDALRAAHEKGIIHRDLKPENVMVDEEGRVKVLDFGLAKLRLPDAADGDSMLSTQAMTEAGVVMGTMPYMSPEQVQGTPVDPRTDIFSLGILLYEMACGMRPFRGENSASLISSIMRDEPESVAELKPGLPQRLVETIERCLEKNREDRFPSARELHKELVGLRDEVTAGQAAVARPRSKIVALGTIPRILIAAVLVLTVVAGALWLVNRGPGEPREPTAEGPQISSLAVLPLRNLSGDPEQDYFVDGMTEALIADLAKIASLRTISRQSVMRYKDSTLSLPEIAQELKVDALVEGSVQRSPSRVKIIAQLIQAEPERHLWVETYERDLEDILKLQSEVARAIVDSIRIQLTPQEEARLTDVRSVDPKAHEAVLKGRYFYNRWPDPEFAHCEEYFQQAIEVQPTYADAHAGLASCFAIMPWHYPPREVLPKAREAAREALQLDPNQGDAWAALGAVNLYLDWDWTASRENFQKALDLAPNSASTRMLSMNTPLFLGHFDEAIQMAERAVELDPLSLTMNRALSFAYWISRRYEDYAAQAAITLELSPQNPMARFDLANAYALQGFREEVQAELNARDPGWCGEELFVLATLGERASALERIEPFDRCKDHQDAFLTAMVYAALGETEDSLSWLERAYDERSAMMPQIGTNPALDSLRNEPRFQELLTRMNFPEN